MLFKKENLINMRKLRENNGFTMVEVLISILIILIAIFAVMGLVLIIIKGNLQSKRSTVATTIAQEKLEDIIRKGHDHADLTANSTGATNTAYKTFNWYIDVQDDTPATNTKTVAVEVWWGAVGSGTTRRSVTLQTILAQ